MANYRTALGKSVDMAALQTRNERVRAVGNMSVNARGDTIDAMGNIIKPVTEKVNEKYSKTVGNKTAQPRKANSQSQRQTAPAPEPVQEPKVDLSELTELERELEENAEDDIEVEKIKAAEVKKAKK